MVDINQRPLSFGEKIDVFHIERVLGAGGFGITYLATDTSLEREVAIKEYFPQNAWREQESRVVRTNEGDSKNSFQIGLERFYKEGQILAKFKHPNIVGVQRIIPSNDTAYLVMDYEHGETLDSYMERLGRPLTFEETEAIFNPLLDGLSAIHGKGLLHLDIKPENIFLRSDSTPVLIDFGGARHDLGKASRNVSFLVASDGYAPNEQYSGSGQSLKPITDIYATGATLYFCLTNQVPAEAQIRANALIDNLPDPLIPISQLVNTSAYPSNFLKAIDDALNMRASSRPQTVREFQQRLFNSVPAPKPTPDPIPTPIPPIPVPNPIPKKETGTNWTLATIGLIIVSLLAIILWKIKDPTPSGNISITDETIKHLKKQNKILEDKKKRKEEDAKREVEIEALRNENERKAEIEALRKENERLAEIEALRKEKEMKQAEEEKIRNSELERKKQDKLAAGAIIMDYYSAIEKQDTSSLMDLWKDRYSDKAQKAKRILEAGGGVCKVLDGSRFKSYSEYHTTIYVRVKCDEGRRQKIYEVNFELEKVGTDWKIIKFYSE